jgi:hypothetical protein
VLGEIAALFAGTGPNTLDHRVVLTQGAPLRIRVEPGTPDAYPLKLIDA